MDAKCRLSGASLDVVLDLGRQPLGNGFLPQGSDTSVEYFYHLRCGFSEDSCLFQLVEQPAPELMFHGNYAFQSGTSRVMSAHFASLANELQDRFSISSSDGLVVEIGCNDGVFLKNFAKAGIRHVGVEPSDNVASIAESQGVTVRRQFFNGDAAKGIRDEHGGAQLIFAANALCHIPDVQDIARSVEVLLDDAGVFVFEDPYLGDVIRLGSYDQIYDEHVFLFSALSVDRIFRNVGLELIDLTPLPTHGGSMRYTLARPGRYGIEPIVAQILEAEMAHGLHLTSTYHDFADRVSTSARGLHSTLEKLIHRGEKVVAYGATSKSTTIYNYANIGPELISAVFDSTPAKQGTVTPGMHIPVVSEQEFVLSDSRYAFLGAWNHASEIRAKNAAFEARGGKWITHVPQVHTVEQ